MDLSAPDFSDILDLADGITAAFYSNGDGPSRADGFVSRLRARLRMELGTWPEGIPAPPPEPDRAWNEAWMNLRSRVDAMGELFVGMANGPYLLLLRARDPRRVIQALDVDPAQRVSIHWSPSVANGERWTITLIDAPMDLELTFALPAPVAAWIFDEDADARRRAIQFKEQFLSTITIYRHIDGCDQLYRLRYSPEEASEFRRRPR